MKLIKEPTIPMYSPSIKFHIGNVKYKSWENFLSDAYWNAPLDED